MLKLPSINRVDPKVLKNDKKQTFNIFIIDFGNFSQKLEELLPLKPFQNRSYKIYVLSLSKCNINSIKLTQFKFN